MRRASLSSFVMLGVVAMAACKRERAPIRETAGSATPVMATASTTADASPAASSSALTSNATDAGVDASADASTKSASGCIITSMDDSTTVTLVGKLGVDADFTGPDGAHTRPFILT